MALDQRWMGSVGYALGRLGDDDADEVNIRLFGGQRRSDLSVNHDLVGPASDRR